MHLKYISIPALIAFAGGDPWAINRTLQAGSPLQISNLANAFHAAGRSTAEADTTFAQARSRFDAAWNHQDGDHPINYSAEVQRATKSLGNQSVQLPRIGADLEEIAASLAAAQRTAAGQIGTLEAQLKGLDVMIAEAVELENEHPNLSAADRDALDAYITSLEDDAIRDTKAALGQLQSTRDGYSNTLQTALGTLKGDGYDPAGIRAQEGPLSPAPQLPDDPNRFAQVWNSLTPEQKDAEYARDHFIGNHGGMPFTDRDHYNRIHLDELQTANNADLDRLRAQHPDWANGKMPFLKTNEYLNWRRQWDAANRARDGYSKVKDSLGPPPDKVAPGKLPRYLGVIDDKGHAAVSINNPDTAKRDATFVPGTGQDLTRFDASALKSERMLSATLAADKSLRPQDVSVTTWMGYDRPMSLVDAASTSYAYNGAAALDDFQAGLRASHNDALAGGPSLNTVIGHSYGSTEVGAAALGGRHLDANNVVAVGSPGVLAGHASDLNLDPGAHVFATRAQNDVIGVVTGMTLGPDPMSSKFGGIPFEAAPGPGWPFGLPTVAAHSSYWDTGNPALDNMGRIIAGRVDVTPPTFTP
ncbi:putative alpha/beta hydrolase [Mycobacterium sp. Marseille-P9652]|uniref:putative alpha/beta hydrolase n=1 Tax=Mycobacterium sp. Marseille-P9652 TaxID=2654950 RepID=UPI001E5C8B65|nr:alpha/beta hydrolase [Mycobacterium sp. Marseille-P9652]